MTEVAAATGAPAATVTVPDAGTNGTTAATTTAPAAFSWDSVTLDPELKNLVTDRQWKTPNDLAKSYQNLEKLTGVPPEQIIKMPKGDDPAAWNEVWNRLGRPIDAAGYKLPVPDGDKSGFDKIAAGWFHEAGLTQAGATKLATKWNEFQASQVKAYNDQMTARDTTEVAALKSEWGPDYEKHAAIVDKAAQVFGMTADQLGALKQVMGPKAAMTFMRDIGSRLGVEDGIFPDSQQPAGFNNMSPQQAQAEISRLQKDRLFAKEFNSDDPRVKSEARSKMARLSQIAAPGMTSLA